MHQLLKASIELFKALPRGQVRERNFYVLIGSNQVSHIVSSAANLVDNFGETSFRKPEHERKSPTGFECTKTSRDAKPVFGRSPYLGLHPNPFCLSGFRRQKIHKIQFYALCFNLSLSSHNIAGQNLWLRATENLKFSDDEKAI